MRIINLNFKTQKGKNVFLSSQFVELMGANVDNKFISIQNFFFEIACDKL